MLNYQRVDPTKATHIWASPHGEDFKANVRCHRMRWRSEWSVRSRTTGVIKCPNWTSPKYWGYNFQEIFEGDVQYSQNGTFTNPWTNIEDIEDSRPPLLDAKSQNTSEIHQFLRKIRPDRCFGSSQSSPVWDSNRLVPYQIWPLHHHIFPVKLPSIEISGPFSERPIYKSDHDETKGAFSPPQRWPPTWLTGHFGHFHWKKASFEATNGPFLNAVEPFAILGVLLSSESHIIANLRLLSKKWCPMEIDRLLSSKLTKPYLLWVKIPIVSWSWRILSSCLAAKQGFPSSFKSPGLPSGNFT